MVVNEARSKKKTDQEVGNERLNKQETAGNRNQEDEMIDERQADEAIAPLLLQNSSCTKNLEGALLTSGPGDVRRLIGTACHFP